ncbi:hypothetical protein GJ496_003777 [Pomphorhynchus laevis]|nr:hypothetical protein GJ496_003777 [Pomphorhynchus laevis]
MRKHANSNVFRGTYSRCLHAILWIGNCIFLEYIQSLRVTLTISKTEFIVNRMSVDDRLNQLKSNIRSVLISAKDGLTSSELIQNYKEFIGGQIPFHDYGFRSLHGFLQQIPDVCRTEPQHCNCIYYAVADNLTRNIQKFVNIQNFTKNKNNQEMREYTPTSGSIGFDQTDNNRSTNCNKSLTTNRKISNLTSISRYLQQSNAIDITDINNLNEKIPPLYNLKTSNHDNQPIAYPQTFFTDNCSSNNSINTDVDNIPGFDKSNYEPSYSITTDQSDSTDNTETLQSLPNTTNAVETNYYRNAQISAYNNQENAYNNTDIDRRQSLSLFQNNELLILQHLAHFPDGIPLHSLMDKIKEKTNESVSFQSIDELRSNLMKLSPQISIDVDSDIVTLSRFLVSNKTSNQDKTPCRASPLLKLSSATINSPDHDEIIFKDRIIRIVKDYPDGININSIQSLYLDRFNTSLNLKHHSTLEQLISNITGLKIVMTNDRNYMVITTQDTEPMRSFISTSKIVTNSTSADVIKSANVDMTKSVSADATKSAYADLAKSSSADISKSTFADIINSPSADASTISKESSTSSHCKAVHTLNNYAYFKCKFTEMELADLNKPFKAVIIAFFSIENFFIQPTYAKLQYQELFNGMMQFYSSRGPGTATTASIPIKLLKDLPGEFPCAAYWKNGWYRGFVIECHIVSKIIDNITLTVRLIDVGIKDNFKLDLVRRLSTQFISIPVQVAHVRLAGITKPAHSDYLIHKCRSYIDKLTHRKALTMRVVSSSRKDNYTRNKIPIQIQFENILPAGSVISDMKDHLLHCGLGMVDSMENADQLLI